MVESESKRTEPVATGMGAGWPSPVGVRTEERGGEARRGENVQGSLHEGVEGQWPYTFSKLIKLYTYNLYYFVLL